MSLRLSQIPSQRRGSRKLIARRLKAKICVQCRGELNHHKRVCDYCYLNEEIRRFRKKLARIERLFIR